MNELREATRRHTGRRYSFEGPEPRHAAEAEQAGERWPAALCGAVVIVGPGRFDPAHREACALCLARIEGAGA